MKNSDMSSLLNVVILLTLCQLWFYKNKKMDSAIRFAPRSLPVNSVTQTCGYFQAFRPSRMQVHAVLCD